MTSPAEDQDAAIDHDAQPTDASHPAIRGGGRAGMPRITELGPYRITETLGWGGMGIVYAATDTRSGEAVALKLLRFSDPEGVSLRRFQHEAEATRRLHHPNIVGLREVGRAEDYDYYAMDLVDGRDFGTWLAEDEPRLESVVAVLAKVARAVDHAHRRQLLHRDLKPANIIIDRHGEPFVTDFGLARAIGAESSLTATDQAVGTPQYMSPEQARGRHQDCGPQSDVFAIGVMLYEALCGRQPFRGETVLDVMQQVVNEDPPLPRQIRPEAPPPLERVVLQCLEKDPRHRYQSAEALADDLERYLIGATVLARRYSTWTRALRWTRVRWKVMVGTITLLAALALSMWAVRQQPASDPGRWVEAWSWDCAATPTAEAGVSLVHGGAPGRAREPWPSGEGGILPVRAEWCWLDEVAVSGDVRVEIDVRTGDHLDGIEVALSSERGELGGWNHVPKGYSCQWSGYAGSLCFISRNEQPHIASFAYGRASPIEHGSAYTLAFSRRGERLGIEVDGREVLHAAYPLPMVGERLDRIGLRFYCKDLELLAVRVFRLAGAAAADPLTQPDAALRLGRFDEAIDGYVATADAYGGELAARALGRAYLAALQIEGVDADRRAALRQRLEGEHPESAAMLTALEVEAAAAWGAGRHAEAMDLAARCFARSDRTQVMYRIIETGVPAPSEAAVRYLSLLGRTPDLRSIRLGETGISDLSPLAQLELEWLIISNNKISDLSPLRGMPLSWLIASDNRISDLSPLRGAPLKYLSLNRNPVTDLSPLAGARLRQLDIGETGVRDLSPALGPDLRSLHAYACPADLAPLRDIALHQLDVSHRSGRVDLGRLDPSRLTILNAAGCEIVGAERLAASPLNVLHAPDARFDAPLQIEGTVDRINLSGSDITDLSGIAPDRVKDLNLDHNGITDLASLAGTRITSLRLGRNRIEDLSPIAGSGAELLEAYANPLRAAAVVDLAMPKLVLGDGFDGERYANMVDAELDALIAAWVADDRRPVLRRSLEALRAWRRGDVAAVRETAFSDQSGTLAWLVLPLWCEREQAESVAVACGARLLATSDMETLGDEYRQPAGYWGWLADRSEGGRPCIRTPNGDLRVLNDVDQCPLLLAWDLAAR